VLFRNRELSDGDRKQASHAGTYYLVVHVHIDTVRPR
jgi:hypothetical protein